MPSALAKAPVIVVVHGTGDCPVDPEAFTMLYLEHPPDVAELMQASWRAGERWWQSESYFFRRLGERLVARDAVAIDGPGRIFHFMWTGENLESVRNDAAESLLDELRCLARAGARIHILAHSHGGNVVRKALELAA